ncbi:MAG: PD-(D/E)XK nuclease family protein [Desulfomonilaceae bacterium]|nr:PD-(D/E)XK nuclease family protein [Desulfomonilaceae bacterium]
MNRFTQELGRVCREYLLQEKWLISPSLRVGHQWLNAVARHVAPAMNVRIKTFKGMAVDVAGPAMARSGVSLVSDLGASILVDRILTRLRSEASSYFASLPASPSLSRTMFAAVKALRLAGMSADQINPESFETTQKGREIVTVLNEYVETLRHENLVDYADVLALATDELRNDPARIDPETLVLLPEDADLTGREKSLVKALNPRSIITLPVDSVQTIGVTSGEPSRTIHNCPHPTPLPEGEGASGFGASRNAAPNTEHFTSSDAGLLAWVLLPTEAPEARGDGSADIFHAVGECNEVREVLRRVVSTGCRFDEVELLHTDRDVYVPLVYETLMQVLRDPKFDDAGLPVTFAEGIPSTYSRPGRALTAWVEWMQGDFRKDTLIKMLEDGLLKIPSDSDPHAFSRLAAILRQTPVAAGRDGYLPKLEARVARETASDSGTSGPSSDDSRQHEPPEDGTARCPQDGQTLRDLVDILLQASPGTDAPPPELLRAAEKFIEDVCRTSDELDNYAALALLDRIRELTRWVEEDSAALSLDTAEWLKDLPRNVRVGGSGPRPGCLHVDHVLSGGHSGRSNTFIIGLDDGRFPGAGLNDPLLLDHERERLSAELPKASSNLRRKLEGFAGLCARLRGTVTLGFAGLDLVENRQLFPSSVVFSAYRILSNNREADQGDMMRRLSAPASFVAETPDRSLDGFEWRLNHLCRARVSNVHEILDRFHPHLSRGARASAERASDVFTIYDGLLPSPPDDLDPFSPNGPVMSSSRLETIGACPLRFFFAYVLKIRPREEVSIDPERWLDPLQFGTLMHEVFYSFMSEVIRRKVRPTFEQDNGRLLDILMNQVERFADLSPPPGPSAFRRQLLMLTRAAVIFLVEEELATRSSWPVFLEASIGMPSDGKSTGLDMKEPMPIRLPGGRTIRARARIDRVDILGDGSDRVFAVWDYKSGSTMKYEDRDPFGQGRIVQHALYLEIVAAALRKRVDASAKVSHFGYFFPGSRSSGARIIRRPDDRETALRIVERLCATVAQGCFPATDDFKRDCTFCDYAVICDDLEAVAASSKRKLENMKNANLEPMRELRNSGNNASSRSAR